MGHAAVFSFCQDKILTTGGEGGMFTTNDSEVWKRAWSYKEHGKNYDAVHSGEATPGPRFRWLHESFGTNGRLTEMQAAIGRVALKKLPSWIAARQRHAAALREAFRGLSGIRVAEPPVGIGHSYYKFYAFARPEELRAGWDRDRILTAVSSEGIPAFTGSCSEIYREAAFRGNGLRIGRRLPIARELGETSIMFLVHPTLDERDMEDTFRAVAKVMAVATR
jgi:dTDP-4-amino-4,6-dideoxygalactose transaminase